MAGGRKVLCCERWLSKVIGRLEVDTRKCGGVKKSVLCCFIR
jgi:hypothetical protein